MKDLISRADAIEAMERIGSLDTDADREYARSIIKELPSAEADCSTCKHKDKDWDSEECDSCCGNNNHYTSADAVSREDTVTLNSPISIQAEMVAVVRCKDCRFAMVRTKEEMNKPIKPQPILCEWLCIGVENDAYCSHGERREP